MRFTSLGVLAAFALLTAATAHAESLKFTADLKGADEVPSNDTAGIGKVKATLDTTTKMFAYTITYSGLTGAAVAAHFHGPAAPGANAPPTVPITTLTSPISGSAALTDGQISDLEAGKWYFNVHTMAHKGGEIRGQVLAVQ